MNSVFRHTMALSASLALAACGGAGTSESGLIPTESSVVVTPTPSVSPTPTPSPVNPTPAPTPVAGSVGGLEKAVLVAPVSGSEPVVLQDLVSGSVIDLNEISVSSLNIVAENNEDGDVGSVGFVLTGPISIDRIENTPPYTMVDDTSNLSVGGSGLVEGEYRLEITTYELANGAGDVGTTETILFEVIADSAPTPTPTPVPSDVANIDRTIIAVPSSNDGYVTLSELQNSDVIDASSLSSTLINIVSEPSSEGAAGSISFSLSGPVDMERIDNRTPFSLVDIANEFIVASEAFPAGDYTLTTTVYALPDGQGVVGDQQTIQFSVVEGSSGTDPSGVVPPILQVSLVEKLEAGNILVSLGEIESGDEIELSSYVDSLLNISATSADEGTTGSVQFDLVGPVSISRIENNPPYTLERDTVNWSVDEHDSLVGDYTLTVTPYELAGGEGAIGTPYTINFSFAVSEDVPVDIGDTVELVSDFYVVTSGEELNGRSVADNDTVDAATAVYSVVDQATNGVVFMDVDGGFTYSPEDGFSGSDTFSYAVSQGASQAQTSVTIRVINNSSTDGFTGIVPSADSKIIFVSNSQGSDSNDCLSESRPCKTIDAALNKGREGYPDHILLKRGDTWRGPGGWWWDRQMFSGRSESEPAVMAFYGDEGARPRIENDGFIHRGDKYNLRNFHFIGLEFAAYKLEVGHPEFTGRHNDGAGFHFVGGSENILIEDCLFTHVEIAIQPYDVGQNGSVDNTKNFRLRRNIFTGAYADTSSTTLDQRPSNMFIAGTQGFLAEDNVFDSGGWNKDVNGASSNQYNHNVYLQYGQDSSALIFRNNIVTRGSSLGVHGRPGGLFEDNFFARNAIGLQLGYQGKPLAAGTSAIARRNVITEGESMYRQSTGCLVVGICTGAVWGLNTEEYGAGYFELDNNIIAGVRENEGVWQARGISTWASAFGRNTYMSETDPGHVSNNVAKFETNIAWDWSLTPDLANPQGFVDPGRTLSDYNESLGGSNDFDEFMNVVLERPLQTWDERYSATEINAYIRAGFQTQ